MNFVVVLRLVSVSLQLEIEKSAMPAMSSVLAFFRHSVVDPPTGPATFSVLVEPREQFRESEARGRPVWIRRSSAPEFNFRALSYERGDRIIFANDHTVLDAPASWAPGERFHLYVNERSSFQMIDFLRDLATRHLESSGLVVLHAAALSIAGGVVAVAGRKGAGKTTTLLSCLSAGMGDYFSGDKLFCVPNGDDFLVHPWRDWPHVGAGTIRGSTRLTKLVRGLLPRGLPERDDAKVLLPPDVLEGEFGGGFRSAPLPLRCVLLPAVDPEAPTNVQALSEESRRWAHLNTIVERSCDTSFFCWQHHLVPDYSAMYAELRRLRPAFTRRPFLSITGRIDERAVGSLRQYPGMS
jgi:hypothetical protein